MTFIGITVVITPRCNGASGANTVDIQPPEPPARDDPMSPASEGVRAGTAGVGGVPHRL
jgi:hypothetical protein